MTVVEMCGVVSTWTLLVVQIDLRRYRVVKEAQGQKDIGREGRR